MKTRISHLRKSEIRSQKSEVRILCFLTSVLCLTGSLGAVSGPNTPNKTSVEPNVPAKTATKEPNKPAETAADSVAVTVNGVDINESRIEEELKPQLAKVGAQLPPTFVEQYKKQLRGQVLEGMIVEQLLDGKVKENNIIVTEEEVVRHLEKAAAQQNLSLSDIKEMMEARGQSFDEAKQRIKKGMAYQKLMDTQWAGKINVTEDDAKKYYSENKTKFETPEQVRASHILIKPDTNDPNADPNQAKAKAKSKAEDLLKQIKEGADFAELAKTNSGDTYSAVQGGDLGFFGKSQMVPAFERAAFALKAGQVSDVLETQFGYHIIKLTDHKDANTIPFEQAKDDIVKLLTQTKQADLAEEYIASLKANANIVYPPGKEPNAPAAGPATTAKPSPKPTSEIKEGVYQAKTAKNEPFTVKIITDKDGSPKIAHVGYDFEASLSVDKVLLKSGGGFGKMADKKLEFQFPVMLSFSPSTSLISEAGGKITIAYFKGEIAATETGGLSCVLTQIDALDKEYEGKFTTEDIGLASPPKEAKLEKKYILNLKPE